MAKSKEPSQARRLAVVNPDLCRPSECQLECKKACPVNKTGKQCIIVEKTSTISFISEPLCIGCNACAKKCPFKAIKIINLPTNLSTNISHRYAINGFKLHRLPVPKLGKVLGLVGTNGIGKSTALQILQGKIKPNLGKVEDEPDWMKIIDNYKGSELHGYFTKLLENKIKPVTKIQYIEKLPKALIKKYGDVEIKKIIEDLDERKKAESYIEILTMKNFLCRKVEELSGGELQRLAICLCCIKDGNVFLFDEPSSYLDVKQRLNMAKAIRTLIEENKYVVVVEHDLAILDLLSDIGCVLYGEPGAYGVITTPFSIKSAINIFLDGMIPTENMRFRDSALKFTASDILDKTEQNKIFEYSGLKKTFKEFELDIKAGSFGNSEIVLFLGENGMGKTTFIKLIAGLLESDTKEKFPELVVNVKPQKIFPKYKKTVRELFMNKIRSNFLDPTFNIEVIKPLKIEYALDRPLINLSGGELQRIAIILCLGKEADIYLIDEPSAYLDSEQRMAASKVIKRYIYQKKKTAFIVEHDLIMSTYLADKIIVFYGEPGVKSIASPPLSVQEGMNSFLKELGITFRRDPVNLRPRVNKPGSKKDREQQEKGEYFFHQ